ncbi:hypothetical protein GCM10020331_003730 [Ectobacillus funiculus]
MTMKANMQEALNQEISTKEMAKLFKHFRANDLQLSEKKEEIVPINKNDWTIDGTYYFSPETVEKVKVMYRKLGLTNKEIAEMLQVSLSTAQKVAQVVKEEEMTIEDFVKYCIEKGTKG